MESLFWGFRTLDAFQLTAPVLFNILVCFAFFWLLIEGLRRL